ncbi:hypothetical protein AX17_004327 [Amanita inopinata Kibby_2008]|nr:hypothetical protein AX17_004327 [Amanita inopinata Kibby_2008]
MIQRSSPPSTSASTNSSPIPNSPTMVASNESDVVLWQSSQTTNPALRSLLKEALSSSFAVPGTGEMSSPTRFSPSWQHTPIKSASTSHDTKTPTTTYGTVNTTSTASTSSSSRYRNRSSASSSTRHSHHKDQQSSPFSERDPSVILELMRGVSAKIDECTGARSREYASASNNVPEKRKSRGVDQRLVSVRHVGEDAIGVGGWTRRTASLSGQAVVSGHETRKGKAREREVDMLANDASNVWSTTSVSKTPVRESYEDDADVSMMDISVADISMQFEAGPSCSRRGRDGKSLQNGESERQQRMVKTDMPPPPLPVDKTKPVKACPNSSFASLDKVTHSGHSTSTTTSAVARHAVPSPSPTTKHAEIKLHPLLLEKERAKEFKRTQAATTNANNAPLITSRAPLARSSSTSNTSSAALGSTRYSGLSADTLPPPNLTQSSRQQQQQQQQQQQPRLGMCRSRTAPLPPTNRTPSTVNVMSSSNSADTGGISNSQTKPFRTYQKPFKPPSRATATQQQREYQRDSVVAPSQAAGTGNSRAAYPYPYPYPSPSPNSDDGKRDEEAFSPSSTSSFAKRPAAAPVPPFASKWRNRAVAGYDNSPPASLPLTPESVSKGMSDPEEEGEEEEEDMAVAGGTLGLENADPDSSFGDVTFDISMDALEETMRMYD